MRTMSHFDGPTVHWETWEYTATADEALAQLDAAYDAWSAGVAAPRRGGARPPVRRPAEGPFAEAPLADLVLHINRELIHHGAEICLLRDLYLSHHDPGDRMSRTVQVTFDCADPNALAGFWNEALGYRYDAPPPGLRDVGRGARPLRRARGGPQQRLGLDRPRRRRAAAVLPEGARGQDAKNRVHLDVRAAPGLEGDERMAALEAECERLVALGATRLQRFEPDAADERRLHRDAGPRGQRVLPGLTAALVS